MFDRSMIANITGVFGGAIATIGATAAAVPIPDIPAELIPSAHTSFEGLLAAVFVYMMKTIPTKKDNESIATQLAVHVAEQNGRFATLNDTLTEHIRDEFQATKEMTKASLELSTWMGGVAKTLEHHGEMIASVVHTVDNLRDRKV